MQLPCRARPRYVELLTPGRLRGRSSIQYRRCSQSTSLVHKNTPKNVLLVDVTNYSNRQHLWCTKTTTERLIKQETRHSRSLEDATLVDRLDDLDLREQLVVVRDARVVQKVRKHLAGRRRHRRAGANHAPHRTRHRGAPQLEAVAVLDDTPIHLVTVAKKKSAASNGASVELLKNSATFTEISLQTSD